MNLDYDIIKVRDIIARVETLERLRVGKGCLTYPRGLLEKLKGLGRNQQWRGDWYPDSLIRNDYFPTYARKVAEEVGLIDVNAKWPNNHINWERAAEELREDWQSVDAFGAVYWVLGA